MEDLSRAPLKEVMGLYDKFGFEWSAEVKREVEAMTSTASDDFYGTKRNSKTQIDKWRDALASEQIEAIQRGCPPHGTGLYEGF
ncbi:MAG: hypothetical protein JSV76_00080 [Candidatus Bathyarchaeota archaeon]|nr:MAG: hypothetical protein JSV76_00080 [Candidatus Bathyarchaeota archaeon]